MFLSERSNAKSIRFISSPRSTDLHLKLAENHEPPPSDICDETQTAPFLCKNYHPQDGRGDAGLKQPQRRGIIGALRAIGTASKYVGSKVVAAKKRIKHWMNGSHPIPTTPDDMRQIVGEFPVKNLKQRADAARKKASEELDQEYKSANPDASDLLEVWSSINDVWALGDYYGERMALALLIAVLETPREAALREVAGDARKIPSSHAFKRLINCSKIRYVEQWYKAISGQPS